MREKEYRHTLVVGIMPTLPITFSKMTFAPVLKTKLKLSQHDFPYYVHSRVT